MKIVCKLKRQGGTRAEIDGVEYHFKPQEDGLHVANVENKAHAKRFLSISDAYESLELYSLPDAQAIQDEAQREPEAPAATQNTIAPAPEQPPAEDPAQEKEPQAPAQEGEKPEETPAEAPAEEQSLAEEEKAKAAEVARREELNIAYKAAFGRVPHWKMTNEKVEEAIREKLKETEGQ